MFHINHYLWIDLILLPRSKFGVRRTGGFRPTSAKINVALYTAKSPSRPGDVPADLRGKYIGELDIYEQ